jgi:hypothetical protein
MGERGRLLRLILQLVTGAVARAVRVLDGNRKSGDYIVSRPVDVRRLIKRELSRSFVSLVFGSKNEKTHVVVTRWNAAGDVVIQVLNGASLLALQETEPLGDGKI